MSYLSFIIALVDLLNQGTANMTLYEGLDKYLDLVVTVELFFVKLSLIAFVVALVLFIILLFTKDMLGSTCGCYLLVVGVAWPVLEIVTYYISRGLASSVDPTGIVDPTKFWLLVILMALLGAG